MVNKAFSDHNGPVHPMCAGAHLTGAEVLTATVSNTGPAVMSNRTATLALAAATLLLDAPPGITSGRAGPQV
jgi:hypothetical protein